MTLSQNNSNKDQPLKILADGHIDYIWTEHGYLCVNNRKGFYRGGDDFKAMAEDRDVLKVKP
jgi:hypothetical protein